jgi:hypothetical protein
VPSDEGVRVAIAVATLVAWSTEIDGLACSIEVAIAAISVSWLMPFDEAIDERLWPLCMAVRRSLELIPSTFAAPSMTGLLRRGPD